MSQTSTKGWTVQYPIGYMGIGAILDTAVKVFKDHLGLLLSISCCTLVPVQLIIGFMTDAMAPGLRAGDPQVVQRAPLMFVAVMLISTITFIVLIPLVNGATIYAIASAYLSRPTSLGECLKYGLRCWLPLVGTTILMFLAIYGGLILCVVPGIIFAFWFMLAQHVVVIESLAGPTALGRSKSLMKGEMGKAFVLGLIIFVINLAFGGAAAFIPQPQVQLILQTLVGAVLTSFSSCAITMLYFSCRSKLDNFDLQMLAQSVEQS
jgi:hypothetical protein